jgi:hypothetical protein
MEVSGQHYTSAALSPRYPFDRRLVEPQSRSTLYEEEKNLAPAGNGTSAAHPISHISIELSRLWLVNIWPVFVCVISMSICSSALQLFNYVV